jgi:hypothetical protein
MVKITNTMRCRTHPGTSRMSVSSQPTNSPRSPPSRYTCGTYEEFRHFHGIVARAGDAGSGRWLEAVLACEGGPGIAGMVVFVMIIIMTTTRTMVMMLTSHDDDAAPPC